MLSLKKLPVFSCLGSGPADLAIFSSSVSNCGSTPRSLPAAHWCGSYLQRGHFGAVHGAAGGALMKYWYVLLYPSQFWYSRYQDLPPYPYRFSVCHTQDLVSHTLQLYGTGSVRL